MTCQRCATCCRGGGPALHKKDVILLEKGLVNFEHLYTLRRGELVRDQIAEALLPLSEEIVKLKHVDEPCVLLNKTSQDCSIYADRPLECQAQACWDTTVLASMYDKGRITRRSLLSEEHPLWELINAHEEQCAIPRLFELSRTMETAGGEERKQARTDFLGAAAYDSALRDLIPAKTGVDPEWLDFLLGRPLARVVPMFGLKLVGKPGSFELLRVGKSWV